MGFFFVMRGFFGLALIVASAAAQSGDCKTCTRFMTSLQENFDSETAFTTVQDSFRSTLCSALPDESMVKTCMTGIGLCPATDNSTSYANRQVAGCNWWNRKESKKDCAVCTHMIGGKAILTSNEKQLKDLTMLSQKQICANMENPASCNTLVTKHGPAAVQLMSGQYQPDLFCCDIGYCEGIVTSEEDFQRYATLRKSGADLNVFKNSLEGAESPAATVGAGNSAFGQGVGGDVSVTASF